MSGEVDTTAVLVQLRRRVGAHFEAAVRRTPGAFNCSAGCSACCEARFSVFEIEAQRIRGALGRLDSSTRERVRGNADDPALSTWCPFLLDGRCTIYDERPIICRTQGLAMASEDGALSHCELNYRDAAVPRASVLVLTAVDQPLAVLSEIHAADRPRVAMTELARAR